MTNGLPDQDALARVFADPNCFSFQEMFPGGFQPVFGGERTDASLVGGVRGYTASGTIWDVSVSAHLVDLEAAATLDASTRLVIGGRNALDEAADRNPNPTVIGNLYSTRAPFDINGGFYYARLQYRWGGG